MIETIYAGYNSEHPSTFSYHIDSGHTEWILLFVLSEFEIKKEQAWVHTPANQLVLFPPKTGGDYRACHNINFINSWVSFHTDEAFILNTSFPSATPIECKTPDLVNHLLHMIAAENFFDYEYRSQSISHLFHLLFYKMNECCKTENNSTILGKLQQIRFEITSNPAFPWSVSYIAGRLNISAGYLQKLYKKNFGNSCMDDVYQQRMKLAQEYIIHSNYSIHQIAGICGYQNTEHFCRHFKHLTGVTAGDYRKEHKKAERH